MSVYARATSETSEHYWTHAVDLVLERTIEHAATGADLQGVGRITE